MIDLMLAILILTIIGTVIYLIGSQKENSESRPSIDRFRTSRAKKDQNQVYYESRSPSSAPKSAFFSGKRKVQSKKKIVKANNNAIIKKRKTIRKRNG